MTACLVIQKKVCFGSPEFMFLRRDINSLMKERDKIKWQNSSIEENRPRISFLQNTIRALADLVYFKREPRAKREPKLPPVEFVYKKRVGKKKEKKQPPAPTTNQQKLLI